MKLANKTLANLVIALLFVVVASFSLAVSFVSANGHEITGGGTVVNQNACPQGQLCNPIGSSTLDDFVVKITAAALKIGVPIAALFIMWAGFKFVTARGDKTGIEDAKNIFWYTIIGTAILLAASLLARVLTATITQIQA